MIKRLLPDEAEQLFLDLGFDNKNQVTYNLSVILLSVTGPKSSDAIQLIEDISNSKKFTSELASRLIKHKKEFSVATNDILKWSKENDIDKKNNNAIYSCLGINKKSPYKMIYNDFLN